MRRFTVHPDEGDVARQRLAALVAELGWEPDGPAAEGPDEPGPDALGTPAEAIDLPVPAPGLAARAWAFGRAHAAVIGVIGLVAVVGAVWSLSQARTVPVAIAAPTAVAASSTAGTGPAAEPGSLTPEPTPEPLRVHVVGAVASPGVVRLPPGSRVEDALAAAGGLLPDARPGHLNLAAPVADGAQVVVGDRDEPGGEVRAPVTGDPAASTSSSSGSSRLDLNTASVQQLDALPGVGPVTAQAILSWREERGRFTAVRELLEVDGIGAKTFERLEPLVTV